MGRHVKSGCRTVSLIGVLLALSLPATAAAGPSHDFNLTTARVSKNDGFKLFFRASRICCISTIAISLKRPTGKAGAVGSTTELDLYSFVLHAFTARSNLGAATLTGAFRGHRGAIDMTFKGTSKLATNPVPKGCTGTPGKSRRGVLSGTFHLKAERLGVEKLSSIKATLKTPYKITHCKGGPAFSGTEVMGANKRGTSVSAFEPPGSGPAIVTITEGAGRALMHTFTLIAPRADYTFPSDLSTASVTGEAPMKGSMSYTGTVKMDRVSHGTLSGDLSVSFATIGSFKPFAGGPLRAIQETG